MFIRSTGPVVFSDSSDSDDDAFEQAADEGSDKNQDLEICLSPNSPDQPIKKKKKLF